MTSRVRTTTRNWVELINEADPEFEQRKRQQAVYQFPGKKGDKDRTFVDRLDPYSGTTIS